MTMLADRAQERVERMRRMQRANQEKRTGHKLAPPPGADLRLGVVAHRSVERRAAGEPVGFVGTAAVFDIRAEIGSAPWGFLEQVERGAFAQTIDTDDIRMVLNHSDMHPLARNTTEPPSLRLTETDDGLAVDADMDPTSYALDLAVSLERGTVSQMSFAFEALDEEWVTLDDDDPDKMRGFVEPELRILKRVKLWEVSPVTFPAYVDTEASLRSRDLETIAERLGLDDARRLHELATELRRPEPDPDVIRALVGGLAPSAPATVPAQDTTPADNARGLALSIAERRLRMKAREHGLVA